MRHRSGTVAKRMLTLLAGGGLLIASSLVASPAGAIGQLSQAEILSSLSRAGVFDSAIASATHDQGTTSASLTGDESVTLPAYANGSISVTNSSSSPSSQIDIGLPTGTSSSAGVEIAPSSTLYSLADYSVAATITTSGVRESLTLNNSSAPSTYSYPVTLSPGEFLATNPDGSISVMQSFSGGSVSVGTFLAPWATDAQGKPVATNYTVQGSTLVQHVDATSATAFPVVADPYWVQVGSDGSIDLRLTQKEQIFWYNASATEITGLIAAVCFVVATVGCIVIGATGTALVVGALSLINVDGICPSTDYCNFFKGFYPWDGVVTSCIPY